MIISPRDGTKLTFPPGSSRNITWTFDDAKAAYRDWSFTSSSGLGSGLLGGIFSEFEPQTTMDVLPGVDIIKPATLALSNVDQNYNGTYTFLLKVNGKPDDSSDVIVFIASKFIKKHDLMCLKICNINYLKVSSQFIEETR